jgi:ABC-type enterochelin transport system substrate-binding protein
MRRHARAILSAVILVGVVGGCSSTTTTSPPPASSASSTTTTTTTTTSETSTTSQTPTSTVPPPANSLTITCKDWRALDDPTQLAVVTAIVTQPDFKGAVTDPDAAHLAAKAACLIFSSKTVNDVLKTGS